MSESSNEQHNEGPGQESGDQQQVQAPPQTYDAEYVGKLRAEAAKYRTEAKANATAASRLKDLEAAAQSETERAVNKAREEAATEARSATVKEYTRRIATAEIRAAAGGKLADPSDAVRLLDVDDLINEDGDVDGTAVTKAIAALLKEKPYLAPTRRPPDFDSGGRSSTGTTDMNSLIRQQAGRG